MSVGDAGRRRGPAPRSARCWPGATAGRSTVVRSGLYIALGWAALVAAPRSSSGHLSATELRAHRRRRRAVHRRRRSPWPPAGTTRSRGCSATTRSWHTLRSTSGASLAPIGSSRATGRPTQGGARGLSPTLAVGASAHRPAAHPRVRRLGVRPRHRAEHFGEPPAVTVSGSRSRLCGDAAHDHGRARLASRRRPCPTRRRATSAQHGRGLGERGLAVAAAYGALARRQGLASSCLARFDEILPVVVHGEAVRRRRSTSRRARLAELGHHAGVDAAGGDG